MRLLIALLFPTLLFAQPSPVQLITPQDSSVGVTSPIQFRWSKSTGAMAYALQVSLSNAFTSNVIDQSSADTTYSTSILQMSIRYYWRVRAENLSGASAWSQRLFTTKLSIPSLLNPLQDEKDVNLRPTLRWSGVISASRYILQLATDSLFVST